MKVIVCSSYEMVSVKAAQIVRSHVREKPDSVFGLATGGTPLRMYDLLAEDHRLNGTSYQKAVSFNLDEYVGLNRSHPNSYHYYMQSHFFSKVDLLPANRFVPDGLASDLQEECEQYEKQIKDEGGIDLQILGLGENGHIGFNEPGTSFKKGTHVTTLTNDTRKANARFFKNQREVPHYAITMGLNTIIQAKKIVLLAAGRKKAKAVKRMITGPVTESFPASILQTHSDVTILIDKEASFENIKEEK
ncbi:glucosamine-6-phosphate deaminase [Thalassorhabdus alkalitolerans]|uniref:Glucosamine-6-phosphate deaminase n=1 Tax=Thalassorhabdus alkalitolerans TaxID=2282697 RepID=A0ABW0YIG5_9BACI